MLSSRSVSDEDPQKTLFEKDPDGGQARVTRELDVTQTEIPVHRIPSYIQRLSEAGFQPQGVIAKGGMASVEQVVDPSLRRRVARKLLRPSLRHDKKAVASFVREAHITGQLDHPNIVPVHELATTETGELYFTMKLVEGDTLEHIVKSLPEGELPRSALFDLLGVVVKVCDALELAHSRGVIHCDIKPPNIMVGAYGQVYLMDWGIARMVPPRLDGKGEVPVTSWVQEVRSEGVTGTPGFMPPEQAAEKELDDRADVFSVGALIYFILARQAPYRSRNAIESLRLAYRWQFPQIEEVAQSRVPRALSQIIKKAMARLPVDRHASIGELRAELVEFMRGGGSFATRTYGPGEHVVVQGDEADAAYIVLDGRLQVYTVKDGRNVVLAELGPDDVFGETAILAESTRTASVVAVEEARVRVIERDVFESELDDMVPWMGRFARALASRFREKVGLTEGAALHLTAPQLVNLVLMYLNTWGEPDGAGLAMSWTDLLGQLRETYGVTERALAVGLSEYDELEVDMAEDRVVLLDSERLRERLRLALGLEGADSSVVPDNEG